jgi:hypothetical protein
MMRIASLGAIGAARHQARLTLLSSSIPENGSRDSFFFMKEMRREFFSKKNLE